MTPGTKLGPYEILAPIGAGGRGEVYRARDTRLGRDVAIKISSETFSDRFEREARSIAALNHPNICHLYDVGPNYLVMELIDGEPPKGPLPLDQVLDYARQIADALEAAHERGIIHRDLKPGNILITPGGVVKVLDFGLAKAADATGASGDPANSPTITMSPTHAGMVLGTAAYMSPEQARGKPVDRRADIWAFGVVLYEMLPGKQIFTGETITDVLASVVKEQPALNELPAPVRMRGGVSFLSRSEYQSRVKAFDRPHIVRGGVPSSRQFPLCVARCWDEKLLPISHYPTSWPEMAERWLNSLLASPPVRSPEPPPAP
jgi:serine/threonine protein kinase